MGTTRLRVLLAAVVLFSVTISSAWAKPTTAGQAMAVVQAWRQMDAAPLRTHIGKTNGKVQTYRDAAGTALYHVVSLLPAGFAIVSADDLVEPIIAFSSEGTFDPSDSNPLGALVSRDLPGRIARVRANAAPAALEMSAALTPDESTAQQKWQRLQSSGAAVAYGAATLSDVRVAPLLQSKWDQSTVNGNVCYNYYTPNNYVSGCVATALSQLMRFYQLPTFSVGTPSFTIYVDSVSRSEPLMGGDGTGGPYNWTQMPLVPDGTTTDTQRQAIGRLLHDAGATVNMQYAASGSGADTFMTANALKGTFGYGNAVKGYYSGSDIPAAARNSMVNPDLDAGLPVLFAINGSSGGHAVVGDGYGYQSGTMYHHLNMGWSGTSDLWYNLPNIDSSPSFTSLLGVIYNIYTSGSGEIISGRVVDCAGAPAGGVTVTASLNSSVVASATTNSNGIYAMKGLASATAYTIAASKSGFSFTSQIAATGTSSDYNSTPGNKWGVDFANATCSSSSLNILKSGAGTGTVTSTPAGISCGVTCSTSFASPSSITLTAAADPGSAFIGWSGGGCSGNGSCTVNLAANTTVSASFAPVTMIYSEPFSGTTIPSGWTAQANVGSTPNWSVVSTSANPNIAGGTGNYATLDARGSYLNVDSSLISKGYDLSAYAGIALSFNTYLNYWNNSAGDVDISNDGGISWTNVWQKGPGTNGTSYGPSTELVDITHLAAGKANVKVRFHYTTNDYGSYWDVDDFTLYGAVNATPGPPTITSVKAGDTQASIYFSPPVSDGGSPITGYSVSSSLGTTAPSLSIPITISGLTNNTPYTFTVTALNANGLGTPSTPSYSVTPGVVVNTGIDGTGYQTLQDAFNANPQTTGIQIVSGASVGPLLKTGTNDITITGGYDAAFTPNSSQSGAPSFIGTLTLEGGTTRIQNVKIK